MNIQPPPQEYLATAKSLAPEKATELQKRFDLRFLNNPSARRFSADEKVAFWLHKEDQDLSAWRENVAACDHLYAM